MIRTMDASFLNEVANHDDVRPWLGGEGRIDLSQALADPQNIALSFPDGGFVLQHYGDGVYDVHSMFFPGGSAIEAMREAMQHVFTATDCVELLTKCPSANRAALGLARAGGFREIFERHDGTYHSITFDRWRQIAPGIAAHGHWFHEQLEAAKREAGSELVTHDDDDAHNRAVGASVLMFRAGNPTKAVWTYNKWARFAGYAPIVLVSRYPAIVDVQDAIVMLDGENMRVLQCR